MKMHLENLTLDYLFKPQSIAVVGVSNDLTRLSSGRAYLQGLIAFGYKGKVYPVSPTGGEVLGSRIYPSVQHIPGKVDYVISVIPAQYTPQLVMDCAAKGVRAIQFFTAGFSEIEDREGQKLEAQILRLARENGMRIIGPNCMGIYCPSTGLTFALQSRKQGLPKKCGPLGFFSQSGVNSGHCIKEGAARGVYFSKVVSYGNALDLNESDFLEYFTHDPQTRIIAAYLEGVKDGPRFRKALKQATGRKPVIIYKAGNTESGTRAAASHTGAMAGSDRIWEGFLKQAGAIQVYSMEELVDVVSLILYGFSPKGRNTAVIGMGGGASVKAADDCTKAGLNLPSLPLKIRRKLKDIQQIEAGSGFGNPVDIWGMEGLPDIVKTVAEFDQIDLVIIHLPIDTYAHVDKKIIVESYVDTILKLKDFVPKPVAVVLWAQTDKEAITFAWEKRATLLAAGFPVFYSFSSAALAIHKLLGRASVT
jgi:acyl-CoA synthetase (NDP forming)